VVTLCVRSNCVGDCADEGFNSRDNSDDEQVRFHKKEFTPHDDESYHESCSQFTPHDHESLSQEFWLMTTVA
jgi:hypothetical protein